jgi:hypothetical protein
MSTALGRRGRRLRVYSTLLISAPSAVMIPFDNTSLAGSQMRQIPLIRLRSGDALDMDRLQSKAHIREGKSTMCPTLGASLVCAFDPDIMP